MAVEEGAILGVAAMSASAEALLDYVSPDARFRGVSKALIGALEARAADLGLPLVTLHSTSTALPFYHAAGYAPSGPAVNAFGVLMDHPMQKRLQA